MGKLKIHWDAAGSGAKGIIVAGMIIAVIKDVFTDAPLTETCIYIIAFSILAIAVRYTFKERA